MTAWRTDLANAGLDVPLGAWRRDSTGALVVEANAARTGHQTYAAGEEYRPPSEVFAPASLATWDGLPLVVGHPREGAVTLANWRSVGVCGFVRAVKQDGIFVRATLVIHRPDAIANVLRQDLCELSGGYEVDLVQGVQTRIRMNHLALLPRGAARAGAEARVFLDAHA